MENRSLLGGGRLKSDIGRLTYQFLNAPDAEQTLESARPKFAVFPRAVTLTKDIGDDTRGGLLLGSVAKALGVECRLAPENPRSLVYRKLAVHVNVEVIGLTLSIVLSAPRLRNVWRDQARELASFRIVLKGIHLNRMISLQV